MDYKLKAHMRAMSDALISVRPLGGSELYVRIDGEFYADAGYCGEAIRLLKLDLHNARLEIARLQKERATA